MTLPIYDNKTDIPAELAEHYVKRSDGKYEPEIEGITSLSGLLAKKDELQGKVSNFNKEKRDLTRTHEQEIARLEEEHSTEVKTLKDTHKRELSEAEGTVRVPDDQVLVPKEKFELLSKYEELGKTPEELTALKATAEAAAAREAAEAKLASFREVARIAKIPNVEAFAKLANQFDLKTETTQVADAKGKMEDAVFVVKADGTKRTLNLDYLRTDDDFAVFAESLSKEPKSTTADGDDNNGTKKKHLRQPSAEGAGGKKDIFDNIREGHENRPSRTGDTRSPAERLGRS